jgi:hypothetical protein
MYLGDGWVGPSKRPNRLCFTLDKLYPEILRETIAATQTAAPNAQVTTRNHLTDSGIVVNCYASHWARRFLSTDPAASIRGRSCSPTGSARSSTRIRSSSSAA